MAAIPQSVAECPGSRQLIKAGYEREYSGKVGELFGVQGKPEQLLMLRTDRLSIFDFVLPATVARKGEVLIALTHFWMERVFRDVHSHLLAWGGYSPKWDDALWFATDVQRLPLERILLIRREDIYPWEMIYRAHLGGSVWKQYEKDGTVAGVKLPDHLKKWQKLDGPIFTPTTKAESGHDKAVTLAEYLNHTRLFGLYVAKTDGDLYQRAYKYAAEREILILDTKFENSWTGLVVDEVLTPDSSRYTTPQDLEAALKEGRDPIFYDKEPVRIWGRQVKTPWGTGINGLEPENPEHLAFVADLEVPSEVVEEASERYLDIFHRLTGLTLDVYQRVEMGIPAIGDRR